MTRRDERGRRALAGSHGRARDGCECTHDVRRTSDAADAHMNLQTFLGVEACDTCHGPGREFSVEVSHQVE